MHACLGLMTRDRFRRRAAQDEYMKILEEKKNEQISMLIKQTDAYLSKIGAMMQQQKDRCVAWAFHLFSRRRVVQSSIPVSYEQTHDRVCFRPTVRQDDVSNGSVIFPNRPPVYAPNPGGGHKKTKKTKRAVKNFNQNLIFRLLFSATRSKRRRRSTTTKPSQRRRASGKRRARTARRKRPRRRKEFR